MNQPLKVSHNYVLGLSLFRINISGFVAHIVANLANSYILSRWKVLLKGRYFWLRSLGSSTFAEALYSFIAILMILSKVKGNVTDEIIREYIRNQGKEDENRDEFRIIEN